MNIKELKTALLEDALSDDLMIFLCSGEHWLAEQYVEEISIRKNLKINKISSLAETEETSAFAFVYDYSSKLNILRVDVFDEKCADYSKYANVIVICDKIDKKVEKLAADYIIKFPKLDEWHLHDYAKLLCPALSDDSISWLYSVCDKNVYRMLNELDKVRLFPDEEQETVIMALRNDLNSDLYTLEIFGLTEAIYKANKGVLLDFLRHKNLFEYSGRKKDNPRAWDAIGIANLLLKDFKQAALIAKNSGATVADLGITDKQYFAIKKYAPNYSEDKLYRTIKFLSELDLKLKSNGLALTSDQIVDYIICNVLTK